jgi:hypothetical protein
MKTYQVAESCNHAAIDPSSNDSACVKELSPKIKIYYWKLAVVTKRGNYM